MMGIHLFEPVGSMCFHSSPLGGLPERFSGSMVARVGLGCGAFRTSSELSSISSSSSTRGMFGMSLLGLGPISLHPSLGRTRLSRTQRKILVALALVLAQLRMRMRMRLRMWLLVMRKSKGMVYNDKE